MDKMATGRFYVWTRSSPIILGQVDVWTGSVGGAEFKNVGSAVQKYSNLAHGKFQNSNQPEVGSMFGQIWATGRKVGGHFGQKCPNFEFCVDKNGGFWENLRSNIYGDYPGSPPGLIKQKQILK